MAGFNAQIELVVEVPQIKLELGQFGNVPEIPKNETYIGDYKVTPKTEEQTLQTANKLLEQDIVVKKIPFYEVSNLTGGSTVFIGKEVE